MICANSISVCHTAVLSGMASIDKRAGEVLADLVDRTRGIPTLPRL
jgi:hypothetical protein